jgi:hypothetical protein
MTPGPWHWGTHPIGSEKPYYSTLYSGNKLVPVCNVSGFGEPVRVSEADANLIAAAPDLLAALENLVEIAEFLDPGWDPEVFEDQTKSVATARAAIAKAKGERNA